MKKPASRAPWFLLRETTGRAPTALRASFLSNKGLRRRQKVFGSNDRLPGLALQIEARFLGDSASRSGCGFILRHAGRFHALCKLAGGKLGQRGEDQFRFAHMVTQVLALESLHPLVRLDAHARPFLMNQVGKNGELFALLDVVPG